MYIRKILKALKKKDLKDIAKVLHFYFNLVSASRIYDLILQVDSIDVALHLLSCHKKTDVTIDVIVYDYLHYCDELKGRK